MPEGPTEHHPTEHHPTEHHPTEHHPTEHHLAVARTARYWTAGMQMGTGEVWFVLHGYRQLARRFLRRFEAILDGSRLVVAPEGLSRFYVGAEEGRHGPESVVGASWMTREDREREIRDYVGYLDRLAAVVPVGGRSLTVLGFSQGAATATRWVVSGAVRPARLVLWGGLLPHDLDVAAASRALADVDLVLVRGDDDRTLGRERGALLDGETAKLRAAGITHRVVTYEGGHEIDPATLGDLARGTVGPG